MKNFLSILLCASMLILSSCAPSEKSPESTPPVDETTDTKQETTSIIEDEDTTAFETIPETAYKETIPPETEPPVTEPPITEPPITEPPVTEPPVTEPPETIFVDPNGDQYIGTLYTRNELHAMNKTKGGYGQGTRVDEYNRPYGATNAQSAYSDYNVAFIGPMSNNIYLTFDLGYENGYTGQILDILKEKGAKAVFFATMPYCKSNPHIVQRIINEGHVLGNHSVSHLSMPTLSLDKMVSEIMDFHNYIKNTYSYTMTLFRPPMGEFSNQSLALTHSLGYKTVHWSFAYYDYDTANQPEYNYALQRVTDAAHGGAIYLLHAVSSTNTAILPAVIDSLREQGYNITLFN